MKLQSGNCLLNNFQTNTKQSIVFVRKYNFSNILHAFAMHLSYCSRCDCIDSGTRKWNALTKIKEGKQCNRIYLSSFYGEIQWWGTIEWREMNCLCESFAPHDFHGLLRVATADNFTDCVWITENAANCFRWKCMQNRMWQTPTRFKYVCWMQRKVKKRWSLPLSRSREIGARRIKSILRLTYLRNHADTVCSPFDMLHVRADKLIPCAPFSMQRSGGHFPFCYQPIK